MLFLAEKGRPAPHLYDGRKLVLFIPGSHQCRRGVESFLDMVVCSRTLWEGMRTDQPSAVTSLGLRDLFLEKRKEGEGYIRASWRCDSSPRDQSSCPLQCFRAPHCFQEPQAIQINMNYINIVNPKPNFMMATKQTGLGRQVNFLPTTSFH